MRILILSILSVYCLCGRAQSTDALMELSPINRAIAIIKYYESWHTNAWPYVGWGHRVQPGEHIPRNITREQGDSLLYEDLAKLIKYFKGYGENALLLAVLSYNVGVCKVVGGGKYKPSRLIQKIRQGRKDIEEDYKDFCRWKGRFVPSIRRRRQVELMLLYQR